MIKNCEFCNKEFKSSPSQNRKYCSPKCATKSRIGKKSSKRIEYNKVCVICNKNFIVTGQEKNRKYCSTECYIIDRKNQRVNKREELFKRFENIIENISIKDYNHYYVIELLGTYRTKLNRAIKEFSGKSWREYLIDIYGDKIKISLAQFKTAETLFINLDKELKLNGKREKTFKNFTSEKNGVYRFDWYSKELNLIVEYDGIPHFYVDGKFNKNESDLIERLKRDEIKNEYCIENNIKLIKWPFNLKINKNNVEEVTNSILANQQPSSENLQYNKVSEKVQRLMGEDAKPINPTRVPELQLFGV